jgi:hypothetical protein
MSAKEELIKKVLIIDDSREKQGRAFKTKEKVQKQIPIYEKFKRKDRLLLIFLLYLSLILIFMILPIALGVITQDL